METFSKVIAFTTVWLCLIILLFLGQKAFAFVNCENGFIDKGDSVSDVYAECGSPTMKYELSGNDSHDRKEIWHYNNKTFSIKNGKVHKIKTRLKKRKSYFSTTRY